MSGKSIDLSRSSSRLGKLIAQRQGLGSIVLSAGSFACFSLFLYFALIDMVLKQLLPVTMSASSPLSVLSFAFILISAAIFGLFSWKTAVIPSFVAWITFYLEYLTPQRLDFWAHHFVLPDYGRHFFEPYTPVYLRPDILALGFFFLGVIVYFIWMIYSRNGGIVRTFARFLIVPAAMLLIFEVIVASISTHYLFSPVIEGFRVDFVPSFIWNIPGIALVFWTTIAILFCFAILYSTRN